MGIAEILTIIGLALVYGSALITAYINIRVKMKELDVKIINLQKEFDEEQIKVQKNLEKLEENNSKVYNQIMNKVDIIIEKITDVRIAQAKYHPEAKKKNNET